MLKISRDNGPSTAQDWKSYSDLVQEILNARQHVEVVQWLQGPLQRYVKHEIMIAAWGDFRLGVIHLDVLSAYPDLQSANVEVKSLTPFLTGLFQRWVQNAHIPLILNLKRPVEGWDTSDLGVRFSELAGEMRSLTVHGIQDKRGRQDCLYIFFSTSPKRRHNDLQASKVLLPYIDMAMRQVELRPPKPNNVVETLPTEIEQKEIDQGSLSERELEIMRLVSQGKTNQEISDSLNVSSLSIKNHMQHIFSKLDVFNRAQAINSFEAKHGATR